MTKKLEALPWLEQLNKVIDGEIASGNAGFAFGPAAKAARVSRARWS